SKRDWSSDVCSSDLGQIVLDGHPIEFNSTTEAADQGISIIHQELSLAPNMTVRDNIFMGREIAGPFGVDYAEQTRQTRALLAERSEERRVGKQWKYN